jgi:hypothetical protein
MMKMVQNLNESNLQSLEAIKDIITVEEGKELTINDTLTRILDFYSKFVPYN